MSAHLLPMETTIPIGDHVVRHLGPLAFNLDTIWSTAFAGGVVLILGFVARRALTKNTKDHVPTKIQLLWESIVAQVNSEVETNLGELNPFVVPLAVSLFFFILVANWVELIPTQLNDNPGAHLLPSPTADTNLTYAMASLVFVTSWIYGIRRRGFFGYFGGFVSASVAANPVIDFFARSFFTFLNVIEELIKPVTLALRLFGNIFAGGILISLIGLLPGYTAWLPNIIWKLFDTLGLGAIQAFIFALLTVLYFAMAGAGHGGGEEHGEPAHEPKLSTPQPELVA